MAAGKKQTKNESVLTLQAMSGHDKWPNSAKKAICQDQAVQEITTLVWMVKHEHDCLWRVDEWLLGTFCGKESPATSAQYQNMVPICRVRINQTA